MNGEQRKQELKTLVECLNSMKRDGYDKDFQVTEEGLKTTDADKIYSPDQVKIVNYYRFEGESDPGDMSILYVMETNDGKKGTLVDAFGPYAGRKVSEFIVKVEEIQKKTGHRAL